MNKKYSKIVSCILLLCFLISLCSCVGTAPQNCIKHQGEETCEICGLNYYEELARIIKEKATSTENGNYEVLASTDTVDARISYDSIENKITCSLVYLQHQYSPVAFVVIIKHGTGTTYGWVMGVKDRAATGTFNASDLKELVFKPEIEENLLSVEEFKAMETLYAESTSFCVDVIYSLLLNDNPNHLTIADLGFVNYIPNVIPTTDL